MTGPQETPLEDAPRSGRRARRSTEEVLDRLVHAAMGGSRRKASPVRPRRPSPGAPELPRHCCSTTSARRRNCSKIRYSGRWRPSLTRSRPRLKLQPGNVEDLRAGSRQYVDALVQFITDHKGMFLSLVFAQTFKTGGIEGLAEINGLHDYFQRMAEMADRNLNPKARIHPRHMARISFAAIMACVLFGDWLFSDDLDDPEDVRKAIGDFVMERLAANDLDE